ncbi:MAG: amino acid permease [Fidelibacterota bacterium]|nr:MAG: amino acid permease [Candidatus Neomarinimicrobiota bacterium]
MIGAGIFTTSGLLMGDLNNPLIMIFLWITGGLIALCGALCYGELGAAIPQAGGEYIFLSKLYHPMFGFLSGWVSFIVGFSAPIAASSLGFSEYFTRAVPQFLHLGINSGTVNPLFIKKILSVFIIIVFTLVHLRGIEFGSKIQNYLTILKVGLIVGLIVIGVSFGKGDIDHLFQGSKFTFDFGGWKIIGLSLMWIMFAYSGWNASTYIGSEIRSPRRNLPFSLLLGTGTVILLYFLLNSFYVYAITPEDMKGVISIGGLAVGNLFGKSMDNIVSLLIAFALLSSISAFIILGPRVYYSMAKDGYFFKFVSKVHPVYGVPSKAILLQCLFSIVIVLSGTFDQILTYMGFSLGIFPILAVVGVFKLRRSKNSIYKLPGFPVVQIIYVFFGISMLFLAFLERTTESSIAIATVIVGIPLYFFFKKINKKD